MKAAALALLVAGSAGAQCLRGEVVCLCAQPTAFVVKAHAIDATSATVTEVFLAPDAGFDAGTPPAVGSTTSGTFHAGDWVLIDAEPRTFVLSDDGTKVVCSNVTIGADDWAKAVADGTCGTFLSAGGFKEPPCNDHGIFCGCSAPGGPMVLAVGLIAALLRRKSRA